ncbi:MAG TPA: chemotaxis response regulator protein-glutamate methylesterase [Armatimonadota bacterium]|jgi:two-component system chemotaxis response regulator CheB
MPTPIRVLIVDDSAYVRLVLTRLLAGEPDIVVVGQAADGAEALVAAENLRPDVMTLDVEMPKLSGLEVLARLLPRRPIPVLMLSSLTQHGAEVALEALRLGAVDCLGKPGSAGVPDLESVRRQLVAKVRAAAGARVRVPPAGVPPPRPTPRLRPALSSRPAGPMTTVLIASSTGGPGSLHTVLSALPEHFPAAIAITQHLPPAFTAALARRLDDDCALSVREAREGDLLRPGCVLVAPGDRHMLLGPQGVVHLSADPPLWGVRPAADRMMISAAQHLTGPLIGVVLTGMGRDGAEGIRAIKQAGGTCLAESEATAVIYGMPKAAWETGSCDRELPLPEIGPALTRLVTAPRREAPPLAA